MIDQAQLRNRLLSRLKAQDFNLLAADLEPVRVDIGTVLIEANTPIPTVFFPESGMVSIVARTSKGQQAEAGLIGREGFVHPTVVLETDRIPYLVQMQMPGEVHAIAHDRMMRAIAASANLRRVLLLFAQAHAVQGCFTILSNAVHQTEQRLARWLLMCHDRADGANLPLTHEFLGTMLSVRRPSVTNALHVLEGRRLIRSERGNVVIRDRTALEGFAEDAYGKPEAEYDRLLGGRGALTRAPGSIAPRD